MSLKGLKSHHNRMSNLQFNRVVKQNQELRRLERIAARKVNAQVTQSKDKMPSGVD